MRIVEDFKAYQKAIGNRTNLYRSVAQVFQIKSALYPGSHIDVMPSFVIPVVTYIDNFKGTIQFFKEMDAIYNFIEENKEYKEDFILKFIGEDYSGDFEIEKVDLLISQYAGFVGQQTKSYLKAGGILLCNDSHGDATLAYCDDDYEFIGIVNSKNDIETQNLTSYFQFARKRPIDAQKVRETMKGPNYKEKAENYLFRKKY